MTFKVTDWPQHDCTPSLPPVGEYPAGTVIQCQQSWLKDDQMKPCGRKWHLGASGLFGTGSLEWQEWVGGW